MAELIPEITSQDRQISVPGDHPGRRYFFHPESYSFWFTDDPEEDETGGDGLSHEVSREEYILGTTEHLLVTSHSIDGTFESCPRRFEFLHAYMRAPERESDAFAADVGTALHEGVQAWQRALYRGASQSEAEGLGALQVLRFWPWVVEAERKRDSKAIGERTLGNALLLLDKIYESPLWLDWELVAIEGFGPAIEVPWRIVHKSMGSIPLPYSRSGILATQGKIDFIMRHRVTKQYRAMDLKTTEKKAPAHDAAFRFSGQVGQYGMVLDHALGLNWQTDGLDIAYIMACFDEDLTVYPLHYHLGPDEVQDSIYVKVERLTRMKQYAMQKYWPRRAHGCDFYGVPCGFLDICKRRDAPFIEEWFQFELAGGRFREHRRIYEPIWILEA